MTTATIQSDSETLPSHTEALRLYNSGQFAEARKLFEILVTHQPLDVDALVGLGMSHWRLQRPAEARELLERALAIQPNHATALRGLGIVLLGTNDVERAHEVMRTCVSVEPQSAQGWLTLGLIDQRLGNTKEAEIGFLTALQRNPSYPEAMNNLATVYLEQRRYVEAKELALKAIELKPALSDTYRTLAKVLREVGDDREALVVLKRCVSVTPNDPNAWNDLGGIYRDMSDTTSSIEAYERALAIDPAHLDSKGNLSCILATDGDYERARQLCAELSTERSEAFGVRVRRATTLPAIMMSAEQIQESRQFLADSLSELENTSGVIGDPLSEVGATNFYLAYHGRDDRELQERTARLFLSHAPALSCIAPHIGQARKPGRIRLGICSRHLSSHTIGILWAEMFARLDPEKFDLSLFYTQPSYDLTPPSLRQRVERAYRLPAGLANAQRLVAEQELDILYFPDIGMEPQSYFLSFARLAPTQIVTWGHPLTTGVPNVDYFVSSKDLEVEGAEAHYTERLVNLETLNTYYLRPSCRDLISKESLGVGEKETLYICPQTLFKFHPDFDPIIERILDADPTGQLILLEGNCARHTTLLKERMEKTIPRVTKRIRFISRLSQEQFLSLLKTADVMLDPTHFGGGSTTIQALSFGTPVVTLPSAFLRGRISYACYRQMGYDDLAARDVDNYCEIATRLGKSPEMRAGTRRELRTRSGVLFSNEKVITECETFLEDVFNRHKV